MPSEKILLLRPDKAGDALKTLPALRAAKLAAPDAEFAVLSSPHNFSLFETEPNIIVLRDLSAVVPPFDKAINLLCDPSEESLWLLERVPAREKYSVNAPLSGHRLTLPNGTAAGRDEVKNIASLLEQVLRIPLHLDGISRAPQLLESDLKEALEKMGKKEGRWLGISAIAGTSHRTPPFERWKKFVRKIGNARAFSRIFFFGTPNDLPTLRELQEEIPTDRLSEILFPSSFRALGAYLKRLDGVVAVDSGPLHLAQSLEIPSLGILSGGDIKRWFPTPKSKDTFVRRGPIHRHPELFQMTSAFRKWTTLLRAE